MSFHTSSQIYLPNIHTEKWKMEIYRLNYSHCKCNTHVICKHLFNDTKRKNIQCRFIEKKMLLYTMYMLSPLTNLVKFLTRRFQKIHFIACYTGTVDDDDAHITKKKYFPKKRKRNCRLSHHYHSLNTLERYKCYINYLWLFACTKRERERTRLVFEND